MRTAEGRHPQQFVEVIGSAAAFALILENICRN